MIDIFNDVRGQATTSMAAVSLFCIRNKSIIDSDNVVGALATTPHDEAASVGNGMGVAAFVVSENTSSDSLSTRRVSVT